MVFPTPWYNSLKFNNVQVLFSIVLANISGVHRLNAIENFTKDPLVSHLLSLPGKIEDSTFKDRLLKLGAYGAILLQEGAAVGYNPQKKGAPCYHPLLCYCSEMKLLINS